jgi:ComF family protein
MVDDLLAIIAPHLCYGCGKTGSQLCHYCKYDIINDKNEACLTCLGLSAGGRICGRCDVAYERGWFVGFREGPLKDLIDAYKFQRARSGYTVLADLLNSSLPDLPARTVIVPVPTVSSHIRERGYDHMMLIAKKFDKLRHLPVQPLVKRLTNITQHDLDATERERAAREAFTVEAKLDPKITYLLLDDVMTTGATVNYAARALRNAGAEHIFVAVVARQTLD